MKKTKWSLRYQKFLPALPFVPPAPNAATGDACASASEFLAFANVGEAIAATPGKLEKIRLLADYLRGLTSEQLPIATSYFTGKAFAQSDPRTLQVGWAVIFRALQAATKVSDAEFHRVASTHGDAGKTALKFSMEGRHLSCSAPVNRASCLKISTVRAVRLPRPSCCEIDSQGCLRAKVSTSSKF